MSWGAHRALAQRGPAVVELAELSQRDVATTQATLGTVMPSRRAVIGSAVDGRVVEFLVRQGDRVEKDQPLASLLTATIELELQAAEAELKLRQHELDELRHGSLPAEITGAKAVVEASRVAAEFLEKDKERLRKLGDNSVISASEFEKATSSWLEAQQRLIEAEAIYQLAVDGPRPEKIRQAEARVAMQTAIVERLRDQIAKHTMYSRFAGYVTVEHTEVGQWLPRGEPVAEIIALDEVDVLAKVIEAHIPFIQVGATVDVEVPALGGRVFPGTVVAIVPEADERSRTFPVKVRIVNEFNERGVPLLKAGMLARAALATGKSQTVLMAPKDSLVLGGPSPMIWVIDSSSVQSANGMNEANAIAVPVRTGIEQGEWIEVQGELQPGANIVIRGNERIPPSRPGAPPAKVTWKS
ncbi:MAG: efflux RND transporter periplasmic adaptor subunit [Pirellulaceae bacterium]